MFHRQSVRYHPTGTGACIDAAAGNMFALIAGAVLIGTLLFTFGEELVRLADLMRVI